MVKCDTLLSESDDDVTPEMIVRDLKSQDLATQTRAVHVARRILCEEEPPITAMVQAGIITPLLDALDRDNCLNFQYRALGVLTNVAFGSCDHTVTVVNSGAITKVITFLSDKGDLAERAILTLGNFALHGAEARNAVLAHGAVPAMLPYMCTNTPIRPLRTVVRTYSNLCSHFDDDKTNLEHVSPALPYIHDLLDIEHEESLDVDDKEVPFIACDIVDAACTALANIMLGPDECIEAVQAVPGLTARLVALLGHEAGCVQGAALSAVGNMLAGNDTQVNRCLDANCLDHIESLLQCSNTFLVQEAARATGNMLAGTHSQIQRVLEQDILIPLRNVLADGDHECRKQAVYAVTCLCCNGTAAQCSLIVLCGVLEPYCALLAASDRAVAGEALDGLYELIQVAERDGDVEPLCYMLDEFDVLDKMQELLEDISDENHRCKIANMSVTVRKHARDERFIICEDMVFTSEKIVQDLKSRDQATLTRATRAVYCMLREKNPPINALLEEGIMEMLVEGLNKDASPDIHNLAVWLLFVITSGTQKQRKAVVNSGAIPKLLALLVEGDEVSELAACSLGNISLHGPETRDAILAYASSETALTELRTYLQGYRNLYREPTEGQEFMMVKLKPLLRAMPLVSELLVIDDQEILVEACKVCTNVTYILNLLGQHGIEAVQAVPGLTPRLVSLLGHELTAVQGNALTAVGNLFTCVDTQIDPCLDHIISFLQSSEPSLVETAGVVTCNILNQTYFHIQRALEKDILNPLRKILVDAAPNCQKPAARAITIICINGSAEQRARIISSGVLKPYCALLETADHTLAKYVLDGLGVLLQAAEKDDKLKSLYLELSRIGALDQLHQLLEKAVDMDLRHKADKVSVSLRQQVRGEHVVIQDGKVLSLAEIVQDLKSQDLVTQMRAAHAACRMLFENNRVITAMVQAGVIAPLVAALDRDDCSDLQCVAADALSLITRGTHKHKVAVVNAGTIPKLISLLSKGVRLAESAAQVLACIVIRAPVTRDKVLAHKAVPAMLPLMHKDTPLDLLRTCVAAYKNLCTDIVSASTVELVTPALPYISDLLDIEDIVVLDYACAALGNLLTGLDESTKAVQAVPGLTTRLGALMGHEATDVKKSALAAVGNMFTGTEETESDRCFDDRCLDYIVPLLECSEPSLVEQAAQASYNMLRQSHSPIQLALEKNILHPLLDILDYSEPNSPLQYDAVGALANITVHGTREHRMTVVDGGAIPKLVALLSHGTAVAGRAALALGHIAGDGPEIRDLVLAHGALQAMLPHMQPDRPFDLLVSCAWTYWNFCKFYCIYDFLAGEKLTLAHLPCLPEYVLTHDDDNSAENLALLSSALPQISKLLEVQNEHVLEHACRAVVGLVKTNEGMKLVQAVPEVTERVVALLGHEVIDVKSAAIVAVMLMLSGTDAQADRCFDVGCLDHIVPLLQCNEPVLVGLAAATARNILKHSHPYLQRALEKDILTPLLNLVAAAEPKSFLQYNAVRALQNLTSHGTPEQIMAVVDGGAVPKLTALLSHGSEVAKLAAGALANIAWLGPEVRDLVLSHGAVQAMLPHLCPDTPTELLKNCLVAYRNFCRHDGCNPNEKIELLSPAIPYISELLGVGNKHILEQACEALVNLTKLNEGIEAVQAVPGLMERFLALLGHDEIEIKRITLTAVMLMLAGTETQVVCCLNAGCLDHIVSLLQCGEPTLLELAVRVTGIILYQTDSHFQQALAKDILTPLLNILADAESNIYLRCYVAGTLVAITARGTHEQKMDVIYGGAIPDLVTLLSHGPGVAIVVVEVFGYLAGDGPEARDLVLSHGAVRAMLPYMRPDTPFELLKNCMVTYSYFCRNDGENPTEKLELVSPAFPHITELLVFGDANILENACWAVVGLSKTSEGIEAVQAVPGLTARLMALLGHEAAPVKDVAIVAVMLMLAGTDAQVDRCLEADCVEHMVSYLECRDPPLIEKAREATPDSLGATHPHLQRALDTDILTPLMKILTCPPKGQKRTLKGISNLCRRATAEQRARVVSRGVLEPYCALLAVSDRAVAGAALDSLDVLLQLARNENNLEPFCLKLVEMGVFDQMKLLREHEDAEVVMKALALLQTYFPGEC